MQSDYSAWLFGLHAQECCHKAAASDFKILLIKLQELVAEFVSGRGMHHIVHKQSMNDEVRILGLHENCLE